MDISLTLSLPNINVFSSSKTFMLINKQIISDFKIETCEKFYKGGIIENIFLEDSKDFVGDFDFPLKSTAKPIELREIYYDLDKATLRAESKKELDALITILNENPTITIKLVAHTDTRASDAYNQDLSNRRAKSVVDYLIDKDIAADRLSSEGRGERETIVSDAEIAKMATTSEKEAAHQKNRRTEFSVLSTDYVPKR